jgi:hypothetical protein
MTTSNSDSGFCLTCRLSLLSMFQLIGIIEPSESFLSGFKGSLLETLMPDFMLYFRTPRIIFLVYCLWPGRRIAQKILGISQINSSPKMHTFSARSNVLKRDRHVPPSPKDLPFPYSFSPERTIILRGCKNEAVFRSFFFLFLSSRPFCRTYEISLCPFKSKWIHFTEAVPRVFQTFRIGSRLRNVP